MRWRIGMVLLAAGSVTIAAAANIEVTVHTVDADGVGAEIGKVSISETKHGLVFTPDLRKLSPGLHGFHVHEKPDCGAAEKDGKMTAAQAAGGHLDPAKRGRHAAPWEEGHAGDLPALFVADDGSARQPVLAPKLGLDDVRGRSLMIHEGGDNYADEPEPLGGGGKRIACGIVR